MGYNMESQHLKGAELLSDNKSLISSSKSSKMMQKQLLGAALNHTYDVEAEIHEKVHLGMLESRRRTTSVGDVIFLDRKI